MNKHIKETLRSYFEVPEDIQRLVNLVTSDLLYGPIGLDDDWERENYQSFESACIRIKNYVSTLPSQVWVDIDCDCVMTSEPQIEEVEGEYLEPCWESIYYVNGRNEVVEALFNHYVVGYI